MAERADHVTGRCTLDMAALMGISGESKAIW